DPDSSRHQRTRATGPRSATHAARQLRISNARRGARSRRAARPALPRSGDSRDGAGRADGERRRARQPRDIVRRKIVPVPRGELAARGAQAPRAARLPSTSSAGECRTSRFRGALRGPRPGTGLRLAQVHELRSGTRFRSQRARYRAGAAACFLQSHVRGTGQRGRRRGSVGAGNLIPEPHPLERISPNEVTRRLAVSHLRTLVVDDDPISRQMLAMVLARAGHSTLLASSAEEGLELYHRHAPDMVLMDIMLPGMDGRQAMQLMKEARGASWLPVILISVMDMPEEVLAGLRAGADDYLTKPIRVDQVLATLRNTSRTLLLQTQLASALRFGHVISEHIHEAMLCCDDT